MKVYVNGAFVEEEQARISAFDAGFLVGHGAFETMRSYSGRIFRLEAHLRRLNQACAALKIPFTGEVTTVSGLVGRLLQLNSLEEARVRLTVTPGAAVSTAGALPTVVITAAAVTGIATPGNGWRALLHGGAVSSRDYLRRYKTTSYLEKVLARRDARDRGFDEALFLNEMGHVTEGSATNIFCVRNGTIYTPPPSEGLLPGITRDVIAEIAYRDGIPFCEQALRFEDLVSSAEVFLTNSVIEVVPLVMVGEVPVGGGGPGPVTARLQESYRDLVRREVNPG
ncbi:MAG: branched-chain amino acid aminotransferase [Ammonifex sp.]|nr:MAG: branched-chain amino acid aminotransferase [Ammonifex sp.]